MQKIIASLLIIALSACGWHLRGSTAGGDKLAMNQPLLLTIDAKDDYTPFLDALRQSLSVFNITENTQGDNTALTLTLGEELMDKRTAGVGSDALTSAYEITLTLDYALRNAEGEITPPDTRARLSRTYNYDVNAANSAVQEEELVLQEMRRELAQSILRRTKILAAQQAKTVTPQAPKAQ